MSIWCTRKRTCFSRRRRCLSSSDMCWLVSLERRSASLIYDEESPCGEEDRASVYFVMIAFQPSLSSASDLLERFFRLWRQSQLKSLDIDRRGQLKEPSRRAIERVEPRSISLRFVEELLKRRQVSRRRQNLQEYVLHRYRHAAGELHARTRRTLLTCRQFVEDTSECVDIAMFECLKNIENERCIASRCVQLRESALNSTSTDGTLRRRRRRCWPRRAV